MKIGFHNYSNKFTVSVTTQKNRYLKDDRGREGVRGECSQLICSAALLVGGEDAGEERT